MLRPRVSLDHGAGADTTDTLPMVTDMLDSTDMGSMDLIGVEVNNIHQLKCSERINEKLSYSLSCLY